MDSMPRLLTTISLIASFTSNVVSAQGIDGLYQPTGFTWSCSPDQVGVDGGALAIRDGVLDGVENRCSLTKPTPMANGIQFTAICSAEGNTYSEPITITPTSTGISIERDGFASSWSRCDSRQVATRPMQPSNGRWTFGGGQDVFESATRDDLGNSVAFTCNDLGEAGGLYVELEGQPISGGQASFDVDGNAYDMTVWANGGRINTECTACGQNYTALWGATAAGNLLTVRASDGRSAAFNLNGSGDALGDTACLPDDGF